MIIFILTFIIFVILLLPLLVKKAERNLELFLLIMGCVTLMLSHLAGLEPLITSSLAKSAFLEPVKITIATLVSGLIFRAFRERLKKKIVVVEIKLGPRRFAFLLILLLGLLSSVITAIIAALILCEIVSAVNLDKKYETRVIIFACFSIGMGAVLTPIGEPLSTIAAAKLRGGALDGDGFMLLRTFGTYILPGLVLISVVGGYLRGTVVKRAESLVEDFEEPLSHIALRAFKVYIFVVALVLLGTGFKPLVDNYISMMPAPALYWINISSAIFDNATLVAAELGPRMSIAQVKGVIMAAVISGGMLITGNIPNIIAANKLKISSRTWAITGLPFGLVLMTLYYCILYF